EVAVEAFRTGFLTFPGIAQLLAGILDEAAESGGLTDDPRDVAGVLAAEQETRRRAVEIVSELTNERAGARS
ncbi:MAG: 1-deoxy-D-xylulose-5-phosphate reductoisomerase, partial [Nakamurella sp.]